MKSKLLLLGVLLVSLGFCATVHAAPPWKSFLPFRKVKSDSQQTYHLRDSHGPWLILAATFAGEGAAAQADELVVELRSKYQLPAYVHSEEFDYTDTMAGLTIDQFGERKRMRYAHAGRYDAIAVLIGDFTSVNDLELKKTLKQVKYVRPDCLDLEKRQNSTQRFAGLRHLYRRLNGDEEKKNKGPMGSAFVTRNPLLPKEYFAAGSVDDFIVSLNKGVQYSLLKNKGKVTVKVATFRGAETINAREIEELQRDDTVTNKLAIAADRAHRLTMALRKRNTEAFEFHDRNESIVTIGSFETEGNVLPNGSLDLNPGILRVMEQYGANRQQILGQPELGLQPRSLGGITFDVQPLPMKVPRRAIGTNSERGRSLFW
jgi:hypothetical protein